MNFDIENGQKVPLKLERRRVKSATRLDPKLNVLLDEYPVDVDQPTDVKLAYLCKWPL